MKLIKEQTEFGTNIIFEENDKYFIMRFGGNLDLYWTINYKNVDNINNSFEKHFTITKENYGVYMLFKRLFYDIENINIFNDEFVPLYIETEEEREEYLLKEKEENEKYKELFRLRNKSHYNELFDSNSRTITWYSDETSNMVSNYLIIKEEEDRYELGFYIQKHIEGYDKDFNSAHYIPIRFRNSGSSYDPFNSIFMNMYNNMKNIDDVNDIGHQMHIEEYLYEQEKKLIKK